MATAAVVAHAVEDVAQLPLAPGHVHRIELRGPCRRGRTSTTEMPAARPAASRQRITQHDGRDERGAGRTKELPRCDSSFKRLAFGQKSDCSQPSSSCCYHSCIGMLIGLFSPILVAHIERVPNPLLHPLCKEVYACHNFGAEDPCLTLTNFNEGVIKKHARYADLDGAVEPRTRDRISKSK